MHHYCAAGSGQGKPDFLQYIWSPGIALKAMKRCTETDMVIPHREKCRICVEFYRLYKTKLVKKLNFVFPQQKIKMYLISLYGYMELCSFVLLKVLINTLLLTNKLKREFFCYLTESPIIIKRQTPQPTRVLVSLAVAGCETCSPWSLAQKSWAAQGPPATLPGKGLWDQIPNLHLPSAASSRLSQQDF